MDSAKLYKSIDKYLVKFENNMLTNCKKDVIFKRKKSPKTNSLLRYKKSILEKKRREKLCESIKDLASILPIISLSEKKMSKISILRLAASYLNLHNGLVNHLQSGNGWRPFYSDPNEWQQLIQSAVDGFLFITKECGQILYVSDGMKPILGHSVEDVIGQSLYSFVHLDDWENVKSQIEQLFNTDFQTGASMQKCDVYCSMECNNYFCHYEPVHILGQLKTVVNPKPSYQQGSSRFEKYFVGIVKRLKVKPFEGLELDRNLGFFSATATLDGQLLQIDPEFSLILGHLPSEMIGFSGYDFIFHEDIPLGMIAHRQMLVDSGHFCAQVIRLETRNNTQVFFVTIMKTILSSDGRGKPEGTYFCMSVISDDHGERLMAFMRKRLLPYVGTQGLIQFSNIIRAFQRGSDTDSLLAMMGIEMKKRPRGRPRKITTNNNNNLESGFFNWVRNLEVNNNNGTVELRTACKEVIQKEVQNIMESYEGRQLILQN